MTQRYVEVTRTSWSKRLGGSIKGILAGIALVVIGIHRFLRAVQHHPPGFWSED